MVAEILAIGTELLLGDIVNTNARFLSRRLAELGIEVYNHTVVGDNPKRIKEALDIAFKRADLVITTGGLGPTKDDLSKETISEFFNRELVLDNRLYKELKDYLDKRNRTMSEGMKKQAYVPKDSLVLYNKTGTAPGIIIEEESRKIIILPGPPVEMEPMFVDQIEPYLEKYKEKTILSKTLNISGIGESMASDMVSSFLDSKNPTVAPYAKEGKTELRISASSSNEKNAKELIDEMENKLREILKDNVYGVNEETLEECVYKLLKESNKTISIAESCTGGLLSANLINVSGISSCLIESIVSYSNESKINNNLVAEKVLKEHGAVSKETAIEMAKNIALKNNTNIGISTTGIAGPQGGTKQKPVGLVYVGLYIDGVTYVKELNLFGGRRRIRTVSVALALDFLRRNLIKNKSLNLNS